MATIYLRRTNRGAGVWWTKFYHPLTSACLRVSLGTADKEEAGRILSRLEAEVALRRPHVMETALPSKLLSLLGPSPVVPTSQDVSELSASPASASVVDAIRAYHLHISASNDEHHVEGKISILRALFGSAVVEAATGLACREITLPGYKGTNLDGITPVFLQEFLANRDIAMRTRQHYRQILHHFFEKLIDFGLYSPINALRPNPAASLPQYRDKNHVITFLSDDDVKKQLAALSSNPPIRLAVEIMIHCGLRREEVLGLRTEDIHNEGKLLKIARYIDPRTGKPRKLKTGWRDVPIPPALRETLRTHLLGNETFWLIVGWNSERWTADHFTKELSTLNKAAHLASRCNEFRHTYATNLAKAGASLFKIAKLMGNSHQIVEQHYAQFVLECDD
jgi:integrase